MKCLSIRAPWWWFILHGGKDIENRDWPTRFRGTAYIHASKWFRLEDVRCDSEEASGIVSSAPENLYSGHEIKFAEMKAWGGHIVGSVDIVDCVSESTSPWFFGRYGFVLRNPVAFPVPWPQKGQLGFFDLAPVPAVESLSSTPQERE